MWFEFTFDNGVDPWAAVPGASGSVKGNEQGISNMNTLPFDNLPYQNINAMGKQWIRRYALALVKETLGMIRSKFATIPIPGSEVTLNQGDLITAATSEKNSLIERLRAYFDTTSRKTLLANKAEEAQSQMSILTDVPMTIFIG
jgi:hypothetical protein